MWLSEGSHSRSSLSREGDGRSGTHSAWHFGQRRWRVKGEIGVCLVTYTVAGGTHCSTWGESTWLVGRELGTLRKLKESMFCCLASDSLKRTTHKPLEPPTCPESLRESVFCLLLPIGQWLSGLDSIHMGPVLPGSHTPGFCTNHPAFPPSVHSFNLSDTKFLLSTGLPLKEEGYWGVQTYLYSKNTTATQGQDRQMSSHQD